VYETVTGKLLRTITDGIYAPQGIAVDGIGRLYVAQGKSGDPFGITVYNALKGAPIATIPATVPDSMAFDTENNLFVVAGYNDSVTVYASGNHHLLRTIKDGVDYPFAIAIDSQDNVYVANYNKTVTEYAANSNHLIRTLSTPLVPMSLVVDSSDNVYVGCRSSSLKSQIVEYAPAGSTPVETIQNYVEEPQQMLFDSKGNLFVLNPAYIAGYAPGQTSPFIKISHGARGSTEMAIDASDYIYDVGGSGGGKNQLGGLTIYKPGSKEVTKRVTKGINYPTGLVLGP
jgi:sugar lactone lactonase YvrE